MVRFRSRTVNRKRARKGWEGKGGRRSVARSQARHQCMKGKLGGTRVSQVRILLRPSAGKQFKNEFAVPESLGWSFYLFAI